MRKLTLNQDINDLNALVGVEDKEPLKLMFTITFDPLYGLDSEEFSDATIEQRVLYIKSKCHEAETVIITLSKMFEGDIFNLEIGDLDISVPCILKTSRNLTEIDCGNILSISRNLSIT